MKNPRYYIAYGSNLNLPQMERRCPTASIAGSTEVNDYQILFRGHEHSAVATIEPSEGDSVPALVWKLKPDDEKALDRYEGYPFFYRKEMMEVELDGKTVDAMVYVMNDGHEIGMPSEFYLNTILDGYDEAGFDPSAIEKALEISQAHMEQQNDRQFEQDEFHFDL